MKDDNWTRWIIQTARNWDDISAVVKMTGVTVVDRDHRVMTECALELNRLIDEMEAETVDLSLIGRQEQLLNQFYSYTVGHFSREEALIKRYGLEGIDLQQREHRKILEMLKECIDQFKAGQITVNVDLKQSILNWVVHHINEIDNEVFNISRWRHVLLRAKHWNEVSQIINETGIELIDNEHRELVEASLDLNAFISQERAGTPNLQETERVFDRLLSCANTHFADEETLIGKYRLDGYQEQCDQHKKFIQMITVFKGNAMAGELDAASVKGALLEWWVNHINTIDMDTVGLSRSGFRIVRYADTVDDISGFIRKTGVESVDAEHAAMVRLAMEFVVEVDAGGNSAADSLDTIQKIRSLARDHFEHEEVEMRRLQLKGIKAHSEEHARILADLDALSSKISSGDLVFSESVRARILDWWINHTNGTDYHMFTGHYVDEDAE